MATIRMISPAVGAQTRVNGRLYTGVAGTSQDVPDFDADQLEANGWTKAAAGGVGATSARPTGLKQKDKGLMFHDSTLGYNIVWDGAGWRNPTSGAAV